MASSISKVSFLCFFVFALCWTIGKAIEWSIPAVIVFGDSILDSGNNNNLFTFMKSNFAPYGKDFPGGVATGRFTNFRTPADLVALQLGLKEFVPAYLDPKLQTKDLPTGVSFASGGTGYDPQTSAIAGVISMEGQLKMYKEYIQKLNQSIGEKKTNYILNNALYLVSASSNDIANTYFTFGLRRLQYKFPDYADFLVSKATNFIEELYELGARKMVIFGAPPVGCLPIQRTLAGGIDRLCVKKYNDAASLYNIKLSLALLPLNGNLNQSKVVYVDTYEGLMDIIKRPFVYGFDNADQGCCGTGDIETLFLCNEFSKLCVDHSRFLFWDSVHPTDRGYQFLVNIIIANLSKALE